MPFTFCHPAAVVPLKKRWQWLNLPALVIGSMSPDAGYYFGRGEYFTAYAHSLPRSFTFCLPVGALLLVLFCLFYRELVFLLPNPLRKVLEPIQIKIPRTLPTGTIALACVLFGSWTHLFWDGLTHRNGWAVRNSLFMIQPIFSHYRVYNLLQHLSTIVGFLLLTCWTWRWMKSQTSLSFNLRWSWRFSFWSLTGLLSFIMVSLFDLEGLFNTNRLFPGQAELFPVVTGFFGNWFFLCFLSVLYLKLRALLIAPLENPLPKKSFRTDGLSR